MHIDDLMSSYNRFRASEDTSFDLCQHRVREILLVSSFYHAFVFEQDGFLSELLIGQYGELNLSSPPRITNAATAVDAIRMLRTRPFDMVIMTARVADSTPFELAERIRKMRPGIPIHLLASSPRHLKIVEANRHQMKDIDEVFLWSGDSAVFLAMIKNVEDKLNLAEDTKNGLVRVILVVEDSVPHYSTFLPVLYRVVVRQTQKLISEELTEANRRLRMRMRPKVVLVHDFASAEAVWRDYRDYVAAIVTDVSFERAGRLDEEAGVRFLEMVRRDARTLPVLLQSMEEKNEPKAKALGAHFQHKRSPRLRRELRRFLLTNLGYGDFGFRTEEIEEITQAATLLDLIACLKTVPDDSITYHSSNNHFSIWLVAHGEIGAARRIQPMMLDDFPDVDGLRHYLIDAFEDVQSARNDGRLVDAGAWEGLNRAQVVRLREGSLGGKGRGLAFLNALIHVLEMGRQFEGVAVTLPMTAVIGTGEYDAFLEQNELEPGAAGATDDDVRQAFLTGTLSAELRGRLLRFVETVRGPLAVRSSGLLEDSLSCPLAGVYHTYMIPNTSLDTSVRLRDLATAVKLVFASVYETSSRMYLEGARYSVEEEKMAVIIQEIVGRRHGRYFYPDVSGVAQSHNFYPTGPAKAGDGVASVALGLGRDVVEGRRVFRFCPRYPAHDLATPGELVKGSQRSFWAIDLDSPPQAILGGEEATLARLGLETAEEHGTLAPVASVWDAQNDRLVEGLSQPGPRVVTFANILKYQQFPLAPLLEHILAVGERALAMPVELEFAALVTPGGADDEGMAFFPLQLRPLNVDFSSVEVPEGPVPKGGDVLLHTDEALGNGVITGVQDVVYIDEATFSATETVEMRSEVSRLNLKLRGEGRGYLLVGPGRWGSRDRFLGVPVAWSDISEARVVAEVDLPDYRVESSQGSHFFHNLVARQVGYLKVRHNVESSWVDWDYLRTLEVVERLPHAVHARLPNPCTICLDGQHGRAQILKTGVDDDDPSIGSCLPE